MKFFQEIANLPQQTPIKHKEVFMWGRIIYKKQRQTYAVEGDWQGKRIYLSQLPTRDGMVPCETRRLAVRLQEAISAEIEQGTFNPAKYKANKPLNLANYAERWLVLKKPELSAATYYDYQNSLYRHILPVLGNKFLPDINADDLRILMNEIQRSPKGKKNVMDALKQLMRDARDAGAVSQVPPFPKYKGKNKIINPPIRYISQSDQWLIIENIPLKHRPIFLFMMASGCRPAEARALRKQDIKNNEIEFTVAFGRNEELKSVKQGNPDPFPITEEIEDILSQQAQNLTQWVFINPITGKPYSKNINRIWNKACDNAQVPRINLYNATRHSFACQLLNAGVDKGLVSRLLRHSDPRMIERYGKYEMHPLRSAVENVRRVNFRQEKVEK